MPEFDIDSVVGGLRDVRKKWRNSQKRSLEPGGRELPSRAAIQDIVVALKGVLFPMRLGPPDIRQESEDYYVAHALNAALEQLQAQARLEIQYKARHESLGDVDAAQSALRAVQAFARKLPGIRALLDTDVLAAHHGDPASGSVDEVLLCYPGILAVIHYRLAHALYQEGLPLLARITSEIAHGETGIDIHPGAHIGASFFIDHGTGVVIGETAIIGERVRVYQAVTLGAKRFPRDADGHLQKGLPRHPIVEDDVVIYAGATILGRIRIGKGASIGGNVWLTEDIPAGARITQATSVNDPKTPQASLANELKTPQALSVTLANPAADLPPALPATISSIAHRWVGGSGD